jgi:hypothetical protein
MNIKNNSRKSKILILASSLTVILGAVVAPQVQAISTTPTPTCNATGTSCTVSFAYSGDYYTWTPPADVRTMTMSIAGAQGGRSGGNGSRTTATFKTIPTTPLYIYVGGQGSSGNAAAGGFNGGGAAGSGHNDEGSGGGATDIRTSTLLADRIAVAGGGGGTGGWVGGAGGSGASTTGNPGGNGQGLGGGAGTPTAGGSGGTSNGTLTSSGAAGALGVGGQGGSANNPSNSVAGGGGGGGGYYGGGGGGADTDPTGVDGGGGGSGSSFTNSTRFQSIGYAVAWQPGNGAASITYNLGPTVTSFTAPASPSNAATPVFNITFGQSVSGLTADDFTISGTATSCYISTLTGSGASYAATVSGCTDGTISLTLKVDTVNGNAIGPVRTYSTTPITLDRTLPEISTLTKQPSTNDLVVYKAVFTETVTGLAADSTDWIVKGTGCVIQFMSGSGTDYTITIANCSNGNLAGLVLNPLSVIDTAGNIGPSLANQTGVTKIDTTAPVMRVTDITAPGVGGLPIWVFDSEEPTTGMAANKFTFSGTATSCVMNYSVLRAGLGWQIALTGCGVGSTQVTMSANAVADTAGNLGPTTALASNVINITPDEIVNQRLNAAGQPTGATITYPKVPEQTGSSITTKDPSKQYSPTGKIDSSKGQVPATVAPPTKELKEEGAKKLVLSPEESQPMFISAGLLVIALLLVAFAAGSSLRFRRRRH